MRESVLVRMLRPPRYHERVSPSQWKQGTRVRFTVLWMAAVLDLGIWLALRDRASIDQVVLNRFALINITILGIDAILAAVALRKTALRRTPIVAACTIFESLTVVVWLQATGTISSYFILMVPAVIVAYRLQFNYQIATALAASMLCWHIGAIGLEMAGVLRPEALFVGEASRVYHEPMYQWMAITSIICVYILAHGAANQYVNKLGEKEHALREVRKEAAQIAEGVRHGRLSGTAIAEDYALGELLGRGGMGEIYAARRISDNANVAVKVLHPHLIERSTSLERFRREARAAERIPAEHTARILDVGSDELHNLHYIVMEYLRGEDMGALLRRRGPLSMRELMPIARQIAEALDTAHRAGVVHRDLKPSNVFLVAAGTEAPPDVRLLDFGISKILDDHNDETLTRTDALLGTVGYMAPEQALSELGAIGPATDRFSFAAMIYRALCGRVPFAGKDVASAVKVLLRGTPPPVTAWRPDLPEDIDLVMTIGMARAADDRYASAQEMCDHLEEAAAGCLDDNTRERALTLTMMTTQLPPV